MREWMPKEEYKLYQKKISELCLQMGLKERRTRESIEYRTELETNFVFGEVIRMFDYERTLYLKSRYVFPLSKDIKYFLRVLFILSIIPWSEKTFSQSLPK